MLAMIISPVLCRLRYAGENFVRHSGDVKTFAQTQSKTTLLYNPTMLAIIVVVHFIIMCKGLVRNSSLKTVYYRYAQFCTRC